MDEKIKSKIYELWSIFILLILINEGKVCFHVFNVKDNFLTYWYLFAFDDDTNCFMTLCC